MVTGGNTVSVRKLYDEARLDGGRCLGWTVAVSAGRLQLFCPRRGSILECSIALILVSPAGALCEFSRWYLYIGAVSSSRSIMCDIGGAVLPITHHLQFSASFIHSFLKKKQ